MTTALVKVQDCRGRFIAARALLDSCSTVNLITEACASKLNLPRHKCSLNIGAVDRLSTVATQHSKITFQSTRNDFKISLNFLIVPHIADAVPNDIFPREQFDIPKNIPLADPQFHLPQPVDILLASSTTLSVFSVGNIKLKSHDSQLVLQKTRLGWIVAGGSAFSAFLTPESVNTCNVVKLDKLIERFWLVEDFDHEPVKSRDEVGCEIHYSSHTKRDSTGRYIVRLPFRDNKFNLGESRMQAFKRFYALERKFQAKPSLKTEYVKVMNEYVSLGHMTLCDDLEGGYYLPHHAIIKESSNTTKVRVVFDASAKTSTGISLNETLMVGPTIQNTIFEQVLRFRTHEYVITADIEKMYRQILMHPDDRKFQRILWYHQRTIRTFQLNTVTFGTAAAPFLAIRTIQQLAHDEASQFPRASKLLLRDFYVDDFISGADSLEEIIHIRDEMIALLGKGGFVIRQWASSHPSALANIDKQFFNLDCLINEDPVQKTLGIIWDSQGDFLRYHSRPIDPQITSTKRRLLSEISKLFDPLGLLGPVTLFAKTLIQDCWKEKITWDESLPQDIHAKWKLLATQLPLLEKISIPRKLLLTQPTRIDLHGFSDACVRGYGACIFIRSMDSQGNVLIRLVCSKSRVAPMKGLTIPRLELCAASLLKKLYVETRSQFDFSIDQVTLWSDSTIVLCWLKKAPHLLRTFESNRVADIQSLGEQVQWKHIRSEDNPADSLSRGLLPSEFLKDLLWSSGPSWLSHPENEWPQPIEISATSLPGLKQGLCLITSSAISNIYSRFSQYYRLLRVIARILRWRYLASNRAKASIVHYLSEAEQKLWLAIQGERFAHEFQWIQAHQAAHREEDKVGKLGTPFDRLHPFIDELGLIRVGGRLQKSELSYNQKHPILLPQKHPVTDMIIREAHLKNFHAGIQSTLYAVRGRFWVLNGKNQVRKILHNCIECIRHKPKVVHAQMADLPQSRVKESPAFCHTGVDYFGPILIKEKKFKNKSTIKTYGCVFVCMASKAVHIELATDLTTEGFLTAFRRFISRRGLPEHVYSDNGTNFVGANKELQEIYKLHNSPEFQDPIERFACSKRIQWHFNPPLSPHFGGLWEAAVKSFKHHLKRILKGQMLTYEQINTLLIEIEAILNSRPLYTLSADPNDPLAITPAHLIIGRPFNFLPETSFVSVPDNRLNTYKFIIKARQNFWTKWHKEYLNELQMRQKWLESSAEFKVGSVVILMDDVTTCARWPLGVIVEAFPGSDNVNRVFNVKTANGVYKRNFAKLCPLPVT